MNCYPSVSVIIPNYNHAAYLNERIDSVLNQTFRDFEVILLDDCSTDNSREIIESYRGHEKISQIEYNEVNSGSTFIQWKKGLDLAQGDWIWIAESDDVASNEFLSNAIENTSRYQHVVLYFCDSYLINQNNDLIKSNFFSEKKSFYQNGRDFLRFKLVKSNVIQNASATLIKSIELNSAMKIIADNCEIKLIGDLLIYSKICFDSSGFVLYHPEKLNYYRQHSNTVRASFNSSGYLNELNVFLKTFKSYDLLDEAIDVALFKMNSNGYLSQLSFCEKLGLYWIYIKHKKSFYMLKNQLGKYVK
jgi:glycosyltransferase involved in cell wall biosynthesis